MDEFETPWLCIFMLVYVWTEINVSTYGFASHGWIETWEDCGTAGGFMILTVTHRRKIPVAFWQNVVSD